MSVVRPEGEAVVRKILIIARRVGHVVFLFALRAAQQRLHHLTVRFLVGGIGIACRPVHLVGIIVPFMFAAQPGGIGGTPRVQRLPLTDVLFRIIVRALTLRERRRAALTEEVMKLNLVVSLDERPTKQGTYLGRVLVLHIVVLVAIRRAVVRHIIREVVVVLLFRVVVSRAVVHVGDISYPPVAKIEQSVHGKAQLLLRKGSEAAYAPPRVHPPCKGCGFRGTDIIQMRRCVGRQRTPSGTEANVVGCIPLAQAETAEGGIRVKAHLIRHVKGVPLRHVLRP